MSQNKEDDKVLSLKNDLLFKAVYGSDTEDSKFILKSLLNLILERGDNPIVDITYKNPFQLQEYKDDKETILDIKVEADLQFPDLDIYDDDDMDEDDHKRKKLIDVEMQIVWQSDMRERLLVYHGGMLRELLHRSDDYAKMKQTITICITDSVVFRETSSFMNRFYFMDEHGEVLFSRKTCIICIELPKVNPDGRPLDELSPLEICLEYLKYADENGSEYVEALIRKGGEALEMSEEKLKRVTEEEHLREKALAREKFLMDEANRKARDERYKRNMERMREQARELEQQARELVQQKHEIDQQKNEINQEKMALEQKSQVMDDIINQIKEMGIDVDELCREHGYDIAEIKQSKLEK